jgi:hypothetical protein
MPALYTITTRASGTILTAAIYNADHQNHVNNGDAPHLGGFSASVSQMKQQTSPGDVGSESLSLSISDELARIRYMIALQRGTTFWYGSSAAMLGGMNYLRNSNFLVASRQGQTGANYTANAGNPYTFDQFYLVNGASQAGSVTVSPAIVQNDTQSIGINRAAGQTGLTQMWIGQPFTLAQIIPLRGKQVSIGVTFRTDPGWTAPNISLQIAIGTGTASKLINGFTGVLFPVSVTFSTSANVPVTRISATGVIPVNTTQMEWRVVWAPLGTAPAQDSIFLAQGKLELGSIDTPYIPPDPYAELIELSSFYWKSFPLGVNPAQNAGLPGIINMPQAVAASAGTLANPIRWSNRMIKAPTVVTFNPQAANTQARNLVLPADCSGIAIGGIDESGCQISFTTAVGSAPGQYNAIHLTADAGL